jgi:D-glycero-D-manno-heptose 1,7-bisphosphate phosphatase
MLLEAITDWGLDPNKCVLLGDKSTDVAAAQAAGVRGMLLAHGEDVSDAVRRALSTPN